ncbi:ABC transporter permease [Oceanidesulfovibrio marinus]|uniref:ABC transporter permease n=1 Tax=Oceanidesulfovibrio marinus TaxID=370038 RepID=A0ABX6NEB2_9BACT|nr:ABC transporter permease [Oceanidesulfovibrio marinus]QJT08943.1 ABC transporter permease [Oceanidesulfovibrio marinus]
MLGFKAVRRREPLAWGTLPVFLAALALCLAVSELLLVSQGKPLFSGLFLLWDGGFAHFYSLEDTIIKGMPIFLCSLGVAVSFRMQIWNIGAEGQFAMGAIGATWAALTFPGLPSWALIPLMMLCAAVTGGIWALGPAILRVRYGVNEIIVTLMGNYIAILVLDYLVYGPWKDPVSFGFPMTEQFSPAATIGTIPGTRIHWGIAICIAVSVVLWVFLRRTRLGYELKASGEGVKPALYAHMPYAGLVMLVMALCGILAGWAGCLEASATVGRLQPSMMVGYGYTAVVVAWLARLRISSIAFYSFLLAGLRVGVENLQLELQVPAAFGGILEGALLLTVLAGQFFERYRIVPNKRGNGA